MEEKHKFTQNIPKEEKEPIKNKEILNQNEELKKKKKKKILLKITKKY